MNVSATTCSSLKISIKRDFIRETRFWQFSKTSYYQLLNWCSRYYYNSFWSYVGYSSLFSFRYLLHNLDKFFSLVMNTPCFALKYFSFKGAGLLKTSLKILKNPQTSSYIYQILTAHNFNLRSSDLNNFF